MEAFLTANYAYFTVRETATLLRVSEKTVGNYARRGKLHAWQPAGCRIIRIHRDDLEKFLGRRLTDAEIQAVTSQTNKK